MPELPEVENVRRGLENLVDQKIVQIFRSQKKLKIDSSLDLQDLVGAKILQILRRARYLIINFSNKKSLIVHLGMSGKIRLEKDFDKLKHDHFACEFEFIPKPIENLDFHKNQKSVVDADIHSLHSNSKVVKFDHKLNLIKYNSWLILNDTRRFGFVDLVETKDLSKHKTLCKLGLEPLSGEFNFLYFSQKLRDKKMNIKTTLMDNEIVVGVGNIYANESLFDASISPIRSSCSLKEKEIKKLLTSIKKIIKKAIDLGGSSISDYVQVNGNSGKFQNSFKVYGREKLNCLICKNLVQKIKQNGRSTFYCESCQK